MKTKLVRNPNTNAVMLIDGCYAYTIDGTPYSIDRAENWPDATKSNGKPFTLFDWQASPGDYGPHYVVARIETMTADNFHFTVGGSVVYIRAWARENNCHVTLLNCFADRNSARASAEVEW